MSTNVHSDPRGQHVGRRLLILARLAWLVVALTTVLLLSAATPARYRQLREVSLVTPFVTLDRRSRSRMVFK